jgi:penicillin amidase
MPASEMPHLINPESGFVNNANNDPIGTTLDNNPLNQLRPGGNGIYYLNPGYAAYRMGRVDREVKAMVDSADVSVQDFIDLQANVSLLDAELVLPTLLAQFQGLNLPAQSPMAQALDVLSTWDYSTPTGLAEGWDAGDDPDLAVPPSQTEIRHSAAATVFALWRSMLIRNTIDATLTAVGLGANLPPSGLAYDAFKYHLLNYPTRGGVGASGLNFFSQGLAPTVQASLQQALDLLASDSFTPAFANSSNVLDYRWGKLHRIVFDHTLNADPLNIPNGGGFTSLAADLPGLARQGGYEAVDASSHNARANTLNGFMFGSGPSRRFIGHMDPAGVEALEVIPGGQSGVFYSPNFASQLPLWLTNDYHPLALGEADALDVAVSITTFNPAN